MVTSRHPLARGTSSIKFSPAFFKRRRAGAAEAPRAPQCAKSLISAFSFRQAFSFAPAASKEKADKQGLIALFDRRFFLWRQKAQRKKLRKKERPVLGAPRPEPSPPFEKGGRKLFIGAPRRLLKKAGEN